jgi:acetyltransferase-like isoleucine patch superfamily enzyme
VWRTLGVRIGERSRIFGSLDVTGPGDARRLLSVGRDTMITGPLHVDLDAEVHIGDRVHIGQDVALLTVDHEIGGPDRRCGMNRPAPIIIADGAWIGARAVILPGVTVHSGAVVAAGAVVTKDVESETLVGGVPAKLIRRL